MYGRKQALAKAMSVVGADRIGSALQRTFLSPFVRAVNYHDVPPSRAKDFERQLHFFAARFQCVGEDTLNRFAEGEGLGSRPGLILTFDDGLRSHADVVAPILERHGWIGWFMVPGGFVDAAPDGQIAYAREHSIGHSGDDYGDGRIAMTWNDVRRLADRHVVGFHTWTHRRLTESLNDADLEQEIVAGKCRFEARLAREVSTFAWVGGEEWSYSAPAAQCVRRAGFRFSFMTNSWVIRPNCDLLQLQRTNIEAQDPDEVVRLQLSGLIDLLYMPKRRRISRLTAFSDG